MLFYFLLCLFNAILFFVWKWILCREKRSHYRTVNRYTVCLKIDAIHNENYLGLRQVQWLLFGTHPVKMPPLCYRDQINVILFILVIILSISRIVNVFWISCLSNRSQILWKNPMWELCIRGDVTSIGSIMGPSLPAVCHGQIFFSLFIVCCFWNSLPLWMYIGVMVLYSVNCTFHYG